MNEYFFVLMKYFLIRKIFFQRLLDYGNWENKFRADGWNIESVLYNKNEDNELTNKYKSDREECVDGMEKLIKTSNNYVNIAEVFIFLGIAFWEDDDVSSSFSCLEEAMKTEVIESKVRIHKSILKIL